MTKLVGLMRYALPLWLLAMPAWADLPAVALYRGIDCGPLRRVAEQRWVRTCAAEEQAILQWTPEGPKLDALPTKRPARLQGYPFELASQWRTCPWQADPRFDAWPQHFVPYEDPLIGRCYVWRPPVPGLPDDWAQRARLESLAQVHPWLASGLRQLAAMAAAAGVQLKVVSTVRGPLSAAVSGTQRVKVKGRWRTVHRPGGARRGGLHPWGLAVDINLGWRQTLVQPVRDYRRGGAVREAFQRLGAWGEQLGLTWLGRHDVREIQHFEFHPGWPGSLRGERLQAMLARHAAGGLPHAWGLLHHDPSRRSPFAALRDPPGPLPTPVTSTSAP